MTKHPYDIFNPISLDKLMEYLYDYMDETKKNPFQIKYTVSLRKDGSEVIMTTNPNSLMYIDYNKSIGLQFVQYDLDEDMDKLMNILKPYLRKNKLKKIIK